MNAIVTGVMAAQWTKERIDLIKRTCCPKDISDVELAHFGDWCQRSGLDPMRGDCMIQERRVKLKDAKGNDIGWERKLTPMATEAGMSRRGSEFPDYRGILSAAVYEGDDLELDQATGEIRHKSNPLKRGRLIGAWAVVRRQGMSFPIEWCPVAQFAQNTSTWGAMPDTMIVKCARAAAWRRAFPAPFSGVYGIEEPRRVERADADVDADGEVEDDPKSAQQKATDKIKAHLAALPASNGADVVDTSLEAEAREAVAAQATENADDLGEGGRGSLFAGARAMPSSVLVSPVPSPAPSPSKGGGLMESLVVGFGEHKGKLAATLTAAQLLETIGLGNEKLATASGKEGWYLKTKANVADLRVLYVKTSSAAAPPVSAAKSREPGED